MVCVCVCVGSEDNLWKLILSLYRGIIGLKLKSLGLMAAAFTLERQLAYPCFYIFNLDSTGFVTLLA